MLQLPLNIQLDDSAKFDNFFAEPNRLLVNRLVTMKGEHPQFIFIWGSEQTGKTHLAQALCHQADQQALTAAYLPLDNPELSPAIIEGMSFMDLVCIDNLHSVIDDEAWQVALFNLYNELKSEGRSLIILSDQPPADMSISLADLKSRLTAMEVYKLEGLSDNDKVELFKTRASNRGIDLSEEVVKFIFSRHSRALPELMTLLDKIDRSSIALKRKVTIPLVKGLLD
ncbi:DnaA regulatory inactivator Hda [Aliikangiella marina]|uniref:DnaA regulatory inactivator Hda n=1 Tax=Aliikangiella marina TaxID=1712262 RepID=A0A545TIN8_9GAMM|nr:DnaA regulatory inactivator Hda [Aliikangiella marina]TQV77085.1 DnaA regulatory inactivator Hda [Aliikangiella marina]